MTNSLIDKVKEKFDRLARIFNSLQASANTRKEFVKCAKENWNDCSHGPYYYAYWGDNAIQN
jgi:hypothetical protein